MSSKSPHSNRVHGHSSDLPLEAEWLAALQSVGLSQGQAEFSPAHPLPSFYSELAAGPPPSLVFKAEAQSPSSWFISATKGKGGAGCCLGRLDTQLGARTIKLCIPSTPMSEACSCEIKKVTYVFLVRTLEQGKTPTRHAWWVTKVRNHFYFTCAQPILLYMWFQRDLPQGSLIINSIQQWNQVINLFKRQHKLQRSRRANKNPFLVIWYFDFPISGGMSERAHSHSNKADRGEIILCSIF